MRSRVTKGTRANGKASTWDAEQWCAEYHGKPSKPPRFNKYELMALKKRCGLEDECGTK